MNKATIRLQNGFTLIELMIVVAIVGILASIAYPSYQESVRTSRRADAKGALIGLSGAMERHYTETNSYCGAAVTNAIGSCLSATGSPTIYSTTSPVDGGTAYYDLTIQAATATTYTLRATPVGPQVDTGILEIKNTESKGRWDKNVDGTIDEPWD